MILPWRHTAFGCSWHSDVLLDQFDVWDEQRDGLTDLRRITVRRVDALADATSSHPVRQVFGDGFRFAWRDEVTFDVRDGVRIDYQPGPSWPGAMPAAFYSTVAALTLAWRGSLPYHAGAVEMNGKAVLIAGMSGAGKSTLTAELLRAGAVLVGDDLSIITPQSDASIMVERGRPGIRLHPDAAARLAALSCVPVPGDDRGKWLVRPVARSTALRVPLAGFIMLGSSAGFLPSRVAAPLLGANLFRPRWLRALPRHAERLATTLDMARRLPCYGVVPDPSIHLDPRALDDACRQVRVMVGA